MRHIMSRVLSLQYNTVHCSSGSHIFVTVSAPIGYRHNISIRNNYLKFIKHVVCHSITFLSAKTFQGVTRKNRHYSGTRNINFTTYSI